MKYLQKISGRFDDNSSSNSVISIYGEIWGKYSNSVNRLLEFIKTNRLAEANIELVKLTEQYGLSFLSEIDGAFLLTWWDNKNNIGYLYKSIICKSSLYYRVTNKSLSWSTNVLDLIDKKTPLLSQINKNLLLMTCMGESVPPSQSHYHNIQRLPAGTVGIFKNGQLKTKKIDSLSFELNVKAKKIDEYVGMVKDVLNQTAKRRFHHNEKIGVILSGGIDSSSVAALLKNMNYQVIGIHWSFQEIKSADESIYAETLAQHLDIPLYRVNADYEISNGSYIKENWHFPVPYNHGFYRLYEKTQDICKEKNITVVSTGYFGDTLFGPEYQDKVSIRAIFQELPLKESLRYLKEALGCPINKSVEELHPRISWYQDYLTKDALAQLNEKKSFPTFNNEIDYLLHFSDHETEAVLEYLLFQQNGIQVNHLFNSKELMQLSLSIPLTYKLLPSGGQWIEKPLLRLAMLNLLPKEIISRNHRQVMSAANESYVVQNREQIFSILNENAWLVQFGIINPNRLKRLSQQTHKLAQCGPGLVCCCMTELWLKSLEKETENTKNVSLSDC